MATRELSVDGPLDVATAWERYMRPSLWHTWSPQIAHVTTGAQRIAPGVRGLVWSYAPVPVAFRVLSVHEEDRAWSWRVALGLVRLRLEHGVTPTEGGCSTWLRISGPRPVVLAYAPLASLALRRLVRP